MTKQERLQITISADNNWHTEELEAKAESIGMSKNDFTFKAIDLMMNFDNEFLKYIKFYSKGLHLPEFLIIQNIIIGRMAEEDARKEVFGSISGLLEEFISTNDENGPRTLTGEELYKQLKQLKIQEFKKELKEHESFLKNIEQNEV